MSQADVLYDQTVHAIIQNGVWDDEGRPKWKDGKPALTKSLLNVQIKFDNGKEIPLLTKKRVATKDPINEMLWIWQLKSNSVDVLVEKFGCKVWNEWKREDGTIGKAYGYQLANKKRKVKLTDELMQMYFNKEISSNMEKTYDGYALLDQVDWLIYKLKTNPNSRRIKTTLWCVEDLDDMALEPCVYETHWQKWNNKLNLTVNIRSNDMGLGNPYNIYQYAILHRMIAQVTNFEVGEICFNIDNAHVYDRHIEPLTEQIKRQAYKAPIVELNPEIKSFYEFTIEDVKVKDYQHGEKIKMEVAV